MTYVFKPGEYPFSKRLFDKVVVLPGCWVWTGSRDNYGYGRLTIGGRPNLAHRLTYGMFNGPIPEGYDIDHLCRNPCCVNPRHLEAVTHRENVLRGTGFSARNAAKTHCVSGHPLSGENLYQIDGRRYCRSCRYEASKRREGSIKRQEKRALYAAARKQRRMEVRHV